MFPSLPGTIQPCKKISYNRVPLFWLIKGILWTDIGELKRTVDPNDGFHPTRRTRSRALVLITLIFSLLLYS
jgi:hypothetical protein